MENVQYTVKEIKAILAEKVKNGSIVPNCETLEIVITDPQNVKRYNLPNNKSLNGKIILGLNVRLQNAAGDRISTNGRTLISKSVAAATFLTVERDSVRFIEDLPLELIDFETNQGRYTPVYSLGIDPEKSYIRMSDVTGVSARASANQAVEITVYYVDARELEK